MAAPVNQSATRAADRGQDVRYWNGNCSRAATLWTSISCLGLVSLRFQYLSAYFSLDLLNQQWFLPTAPTQHLFFRYLL